MNEEHLYCVLTLAVRALQQRVRIRNHFKRYRESGACVKNNSPDRPGSVTVNRAMPTVHGRMACVTLYGNCTTIIVM